MNDNMTIFNKIVRDRIPSIIEQSNKKVIYFQHPDNKDFDLELMKKVDEELNEFMDEWKENNEAGMVNELADILEVFFTILDRNNIKYSEVEKEMLRKRKYIGGFKKRIFLIKAEQ